MYRECKYIPQLAQHFELYLKLSVWLRLLLILHQRICLFGIKSQTGKSNLCGEGVVLNMEEEKQQEELSSLK